MHVSPGEHFGDNEHRQSIESIHADETVKPLAAQARASISFETTVSPAKGCNAGTTSARGHPSL